MEFLWPWRNRGRDSIVTEELVFGAEGSGRMVGARRRRDTVVSDVEGWGCSS